MKRFKFSKLRKRIFDAELKASEDDFDSFSFDKIIEIVKQIKVVVTGSKE